MTTDERYAEFVGVLFAKRCEGVEGLLHAAIGIAGEGGELLDAVKKTWVYGRELDRANVIEELGDLEFYAQAMRTLLGLSREEVLAANVAKLGKRYPGGYTDAHAIARLDKAEATTVARHADGIAYVPPEREPGAARPAADPTATVCPRCQNAIARCDCAGAARCPECALRGYPCPAHIDPRMST
jgi:NTP pyrophosphatase (non-canonical NTP hydrolase)